MIKEDNGKIFLFSIDLEDIRFRMPDGEKYRERVPANTHTYLEWLRKNKFKCTFFTVGDIAEKYPSLIQEIIAEGHEIACHTNTHIPLDKQTPASFRADMEKNLEHLASAGATDVKGFRAPVFSLTENTAWAYEVLAGLGFTWSSSVLPAKNPLYGWKEFGEAPKKTASGILEIPMTVGRVGHLAVPYGGGIYFRVIPEFILRGKVKRHTSTGDPLLGYFHPYDIDTEQEHFMHPEINNRFYNFLMYYNRDKVFPRLDKLVKDGFSVCTYSFYLKNYPGR